MLHLIARRALTAENGICGKLVQCKHFFLSLIPYNEEFERSYYESVFQLSDNNIGEAANKSAKYSELVT